MEGISRKDLDQTVEFLLTNGTPEIVKIADKITKMDIIPKLYVYTYVKKVHNELKQLKGDSKSINQEEFETLAEVGEKLQLHVFKTSTEANKLLKFLENAFTREHEFCDFDDSKFHNTTKTGTCQSDEHFEHVDHEPKIPLTDDELKQFKKIEEEEGWYQAAIKFEKNFNPDNQTLYPLWFPDDETKKWDDENMNWFCKSCRDGIDSSDMDFDVSCDMDDDI